MALNHTSGPGQEWRVRVHLDLWAPGSHGALLVTTHAAPPAGPHPGQNDVFAYEPRRHQAEACAAQIGQALSDIALAARQYPAPEPSLVGSAGRTVLNGAYLVPAEHAPGFATTVHELTREHPALRAEVSGPWPPFTFATSHLRELTVAS